ncbi:TIGR03620 family F420-dependent LLM class oxidoreductase (plasmid) [Streptomyces sp. BI20]|uniref:TIGR03620 family F420-dependent LLM class oxidoreductase n=1 Tax=Streptomyces sp. BI20 TaxID=3403460 RepID=UPI003C738CF2
MTSVHEIDDVKGRFGAVGLWSGALREDPARRGEIADALAEIEELGYGAVWLGGSPGPADAAAVLAATRRITVATGIVSIWEHGAKEVAEAVATLPEGDRERFHLGLGVSHGALAPAYARPYSAMVDYLDALDSAPHPVPSGRRLLAALGPRMLRLAADRTLGAHPYLVTARAVAGFRETLGAAAFLAPELMVVPGPSPADARAVARATLEVYLRLPNYTASLERDGFTEEDFVGGGSDRLLDALFAFGDPERVRERVAEFRAAGADHVTVQVLTPEHETGLPLAHWRALAPALLG